MYKFGGNGEEKLILFWKYVGICNMHHWLKGDGRPCWFELFLLLWPGFPKPLNKLVTGRCCHRWVVLIFQVKSHLTSPVEFTYVYAFVCVCICVCVRLCVRLCVCLYVYIFISYRYTYNFVCAMKDLRVINHIKGNPPVKSPVVLIWTHQSPVMPNRLIAYERHWQLIYWTTFGQPFWQPLWLIQCS